MEDVLFEGEFYHEYVGGERVKVEVTPTRFIFKVGKKREESILIPYLNVVVFRRDPKWGYLATGIMFLILALILYFLPYIPKTFLFEKPHKETFTYLSALAGVIFIVLWFILRSFALELLSFGYKVKFVSRKEKELKKLFTTIENLRIERFQIRP